MAKYIKVLPAATRTASETSLTFYNAEAQRASHLVINITDGSNLQVVVNGMDRISGTSYPLLTSAFLASGTSVLRIGPELTAAANVAKDYIPESWSVTATVSGSTTFSIGASLI